MDAALDQLAVKVEVALQRLHPKDFELLVDLLFQRAGWQRISVVGENVKFTDMNLQEPITKDRYQVQVKSEATKEEFESYRSEFEDSPFRRLYFVVHSPHRSLEAVSTDPDDKVQLIFSKRLARMAIDAGLVGWLMQKVR